MFPFCRLPDWRQRPDIIIVAPKVVDLGQDIAGFFCPSDKNGLHNLGLDGQYKLRHSGILQVIFVKHRSKCPSPNQKKKKRDLVFITDTKITCTLPSIQFGPVAHF